MSILEAGVKKAVEQKLSYSDWLLRNATIKHGHGKEPNVTLDVHPDNLPSDEAPRERPRPVVSEMILSRARTAAWRRLLPFAATALTAGALTGGTIAIFGGGEGAASNGASVQQTTQQSGQRSSLLQYLEDEGYHLTENE